MAVYTHITAPQLTAFLASYDLGALQSFTGIEQGVENSNYHVFTDHGHFILTIFEDRVRPDDLPFFFGFMNHLAGKGIECPHAIADRNGVIFGTIADKPATLVSFLKGRDIDAAEITPDHCAQVGAFVARLHLAAADFPMVRANAMSLPTWRVLGAQTYDRADEVHGGLGRLMAEEGDYIAAHWPSPDRLPCWAVHADIFPDNIFFRDGVLSGILDFYYACTEFLAYDLALVINAWCFDTDDCFDPARFDALMTAYQDVRPLHDAEKDMLPLMGRAAALRILSTRLYAWLNQAPGDFVKPKDPREYLTKLMFHQDQNLPLL